MSKQRKHYTPEDCKGLNCRIALVLKSDTRFRQRVKGGMVLFTRPIKSLEGSRL